jgi:hypothetical protein
MKPGRKPKPVKEIFLSHIRKDSSGCWLWTAAIGSGGYARFNLKRKNVSAHRTSYELFKSSIPMGLHLDHLCNVRHCVNPAHLEPVTQKENNRRSSMRKPKPIHCLRGHKLNESVNGKRYCKICVEIAGKRYRTTIKYRKRLHRYHRTEKYRCYQRNWHKNNVAKGEHHVVC